MTWVWSIVEVVLMATGIVVWVVLAWVVVGERVKRVRGQKGDLWGARED